MDLLGSSRGLFGFGKGRRAGALCPPKQGRVSDWAACPPWKHGEACTEEELGGQGIHLLGPDHPPPEASGAASQCLLVNVG